MTFGRSRQRTLAAAALVFGLCHPGWAQAAQCFLPHCLAAMIPPHVTAGRTTGNSALDAKLRSEAQLLAQTFGVDPQIFLFDDRQWPNAYARPRAFPPYRDTIFMGHQLLRQTVAVEEVRDVAVVLVLAHEWAHILQGSSGLPGSLDLRHRELHADVLAGWYLGRRNLAPSSHVTRVALQTFGRLPQASFSAGTHGTPNARMAAMMLGYARYNWPLDQIYDLGLRYVLRHL